MEEVIAKDFCIVEFYSETCAPCKMLADVLERLDSQMPFINIVPVNITNLPHYAEKYQIHATPTLLIMNDGELCERLTGFVSLDQIKEKAGKYLYGC